MDGWIDEWMHGSVVYIYDANIACWEYRLQLVPKRLLIFLIFLKHLQCRQGRSSFFLLLFILIAPCITRNIGNNPMSFAGTNAQLKHSSACSAIFSFLNASVHIVLVLIFWDADGFDENLATMHASTACWEYSSWHWGVPRVPLPRKSQLLRATL